MASLLNMSGGSLLNKGLPYDAEIEYLESTGTQYINSGLKSSVNVFVFDTVLTTKSQSYLFGATQGFNVSTIDRVYRATASCISNVSSDFDTPVHIILTSDPKNNSITLVIDNSTFIGNYTSWRYNNPILLFGIVNNLSVSKIYKIAIYINGVLVRDYIPVRVGTTGYLYDKVSGQLFGNAGTGSFILGPDK